MGPAQPLWGLKDDREALPGPGPALGEGGRILLIFTKAPWESCSRYFQPLCDLGQGHFLL